MPNFNGTGPRGQGPMTGRGMGNCAPNGQTRTPGYGRGFGRGLGFGRGWGWPGYRAPSAKEEKEMLNEDLQGLKHEMEGVQSRLEELKNKK
ncbi:MAG: hypothetical protein AVO34_01765 [Firmicutes bacterium ML8_F2]|jgi:hypothetical protein|nr:MAG: hypothetical protein AVO34_01765 [Firmicutes bacterium ML8_F2]